MDKKTTLFAFIAIKKPLLNGMMFAYGSASILIAFFGSLAFAK